MDVQLATAALATRQHGVVAVTQLHELGLGRSWIETAVRRGRLHRLYRGVYAVGHTRLTAEGRWTAAVLACGPGAVLSHQAAAALWDLRKTASARIDVTIPSVSSRSPGDGITVHRTRTPIDATTRDGIPVTTVGRTLADLATVLPKHALARAVESAEAQRLLDLSSIPIIRGRRSKALAEVLATYGDTTRSDLEQLFLELCEEHGIPKPQVNVVVNGYEVDFLWPEHRLIVETDGFRHHGTRGGHQRDRTRDVELLRAGYRTARFTYEDVTRRPAWVAATIEALGPTPSRSPTRRGPRRRR